MSGEGYATLPAVVQFAVGDVEAHTHLARVEQLSRTWRGVADELRVVADVLRRELDHVRAGWQDATGAEFVRQATRRAESIEATLARIERHRPWLALDDLARQLLLTRARLTDTAEHASAGSEREGAEHLDELDRYFLAAADALAGASGVTDRPATTGVATSEDGTGSCCADPSLASAPAGGVLSGPTGLPSGGLPPGSAAIPGLIAVPPGALASADRSRLGGAAPRRSASDRGGSGTSGSGSGAGLDPSDLAGGTPGAGSSHSPTAAPGTGGSNLPPRIDQAAKPVSLSGPPAAPEAPTPPTAPSAGATASTATSGAGRMFPMMPMMPMGGAATRGRIGSSRSLEDSERAARKPAGTPGVPARLRGRSALDDPAASGHRPVAVTARNAAPEQSEQPVLDREVWRVAGSGSDTPLKPEPVEQPKRRRRH